MNDSLALVEPFEEEKKASSLHSDKKISAVDEKFILGSDYDQNEQCDNVDDSLFISEGSEYF